MPAWSATSSRRRGNGASASTQRSARVLLGQLDLFTHADADTEVIRQMLHSLSPSERHQPHHQVAEATNGIRPLMLAMVHGHVESAQYLDLMIDFANAVDPILPSESEQRGGGRNSNGREGSHDTDNAKATPWEWWRRSSRLCWVWGGLSSFHWAALMGHRCVLQIIFRDLKHHTVQWYSLLRNQPRPTAFASRAGVSPQQQRKEYYLPTDRFLWWSLISGAFAGGETSNQNAAGATIRASAIHCAAFSGRIHVCKFLLERLQVVGCFEQRQSDPLVEEGEEVQEDAAIAPSLPSGVLKPRWCSTWPVWSRKHADDDASVTHIGGSCKSFVQRALEQTDVSGRTVWCLLCKRTWSMVSERRRARVCTWV